jgi:pyrroloquinoline-quinone synthase
VISPPWSRDEFTGKVKEVLEARYHHRHPFHERMHRGDLSREEIRDWVANRFCYQQGIVVKDAILLSKLPSSRERRMWIGRLIDQDGSDGDEGGLEQWLRLAEAVGLTREETEDGSRVVPGVRFAVDAYIHFCADRTWQEGVAASLTQLFVPDLMQTRIDAFARHHGIASEDMAYFSRHARVATTESDRALELLLEATASREDQVRAIEAVGFKCDVLNALLDAVDAIR